MNKTQVVVYGSCVARDTLERLPSERYQLQRYIARQSLISAFSEPSLIPPSALDSLSSEFQRRTLRDDFESSLPRDLELYAAEAGVVLWDLTDERLGVFETEPARYITNSIELAATSSEHSIFQNCRLIPFSSDEHFALWRAALPAFKEALASNAPQAKLLLVAPRWATVYDKEGDERLLSRRGHKVANRNLQKYVRTARKLLGPQAVISCRAVADPRNRWGPAPYHYDQKTYETLARRVDRAANRNIP